MNRPWMPLYIADYRADTAHLSAAQHGAYLLLIMHYWATGGLPNDDSQLARIACMSPAEWRKARPVVVMFFAGDWHHGRIDEEIAKAEAKHERRVEAGKRGGNAKAEAKQNPSNATSNALASSSQSESESKKEERKGEARASRGAPLPEGWAPSDDDFAYVEKLGLTRSQSLEGAEEMKLWAGANQNRSVARKANWSLTYRSWMRRNSKRGTTNGQAPPNRLRDALDKLREHVGEIDRSEERRGPPPRLLSHG